MKMGTMYVQQKTQKNAFILPISFFIITLLLVVAIYFMHQTIRNQHMLHATVNQVKLDQGKEIGERILMDLYAKQGCEIMKNRISEEPKIYVRSNPLYPEDMVIVFSFIDETSTKCIVQLSIFVLKSEEKGIFTHPLLRVPLYVNAYRKCYVISHQYISSYSLTMKYTISTEEETNGSILNKEIVKIYYNG
jgi:hypothetical protein